MKKKLLSILLALSLMLTLLPAAALAASYSDTAAHWAESSIERWSDYGIIQGNNGAFLPNNNLTRAHMATILAKLLKLPAAESAGFTDVDSAAWYADAVNRCAAAGIMLGNEGKANPNATITRAQAIVMLGRALGITPKANADLSGYEDAAAVPDYAKGYVAAMSEAGIVKGSTETTVAPASDITRAATVTILDRAIEVYANESGKTVNTTGSGIVLVVADDVTINGTAKDILVAQGADASSVYLEHAPTASVTITAEEATVYVKNSTVKEASIIGEESKIVFEGESKAETVTVSESAKGAQVVINEGAKVETVANKAEDTVVTGSGSVGTVKSSEDVKVETKNTKVENTSETKDIAVTDSKGKETTVETKTESTGTTTTETTINTQPTGGGHSHTYDTAWSSDAAEHWHAATCGHDVTSGRAAHTFGDYTDKGDGTHSRTCTVCRYEEAAAAHRYGAYTDNGETHSHTCTDCNYTETEAHIYDTTTLRCICGAFSPDAVAAIGGQGYTTLSAAVTAAKSGETVVLLKDITVESSTAQELNKKIAVDLNGKTLTNYELTITSDVTLRNGTIINNGKTPVTLYGAQLTLDGVSISTTGADAFVITNESGNATESTIIVADGSTNSIATTGTSYDGILAYALSNITLSITGESEKTGKLTVSGANSAFHEYGASGNIYATISGLEIEFSDKVDTGYGNKLEISNVIGVFSTDASDFCIAGYFTLLDETSGKYVYTRIDEETAVCRIIHSDSTYTYLMSLEQAMMQVSNEETIQLLQNVAINNQTSDGINATKVIIDLNEKTITAKGTWLIAKHAGSYSYSPIEATIKNGNYVLNGTDSGRIRFENGSTGHFENVNFSTSDGKWHQALQTYATNTTGENEVNTYDFKNCTFTNCWTGFEGKSGSCNKYEISFTKCKFTAANMSNGAACIMIDDYDYGKLTVTNSTFNINNTNNGGYCVNVDTYLNYTNGQKFDLKLNGVTMNTTGNAQPYTYRFLNYNSEYSDNANITVEGSNTFTHNGKTVEMFIKETSATNKSVAWTENANAYKACLAEWVAYANAKPSDYDQYNYYLVESNGYYYIGGQGTQFNDNATVTKESDTITKVVVAGYFTTTYSSIGTTDISTRLDGADNANVHIYTLAK